MTETPTRTDLSETTPKRAVVVPDKPTLEGLESRWVEKWKADDTYRFDRTQAREDEGDIILSSMTQALVAASLAKMRSTPRT